MPNPDDLLDSPERPQQPGLRERITAAQPQSDAGAGAVRQRIADVAARQAPGDLRQQLTNAAPQQQQQARAVSERLAAGPTESPLRQQLRAAAPQQAADARAVAQRLAPPTLTDVIQPGNVNPSLRDDLARNSLQAQNDAKTVQARLNAGAPPATAQPDLRAQITAAAPQAQADAQAVAQRLNAGAQPAQPAPSPLRERLMARAAAAPSAADQALRARMNPGTIAQAAQQAVPPAPAAGGIVDGATGRPVPTGTPGAPARFPAGAPSAQPAAAPTATPAAASQSPAAGIRDAAGRPVPTRIPGTAPGQMPAATPSAGTIRPDVGSLRATVGLPPTPPGAGAAGAGAAAAGVAGAAARAAGTAAPGAAPAAAAAAPAAEAAAAAAAPAAATAEAGAGANASRLARTAYSVGKLAGANKALLGRAGVVGLAAQAGTHYNDYKLNEPGVDSSAGGTMKALFTGDFAGAGKSALKGFKETAMDLGSAAAGLADYVIPGNAPVSRAYDQMLHEKLGDKLVPHPSVIADMARGQPAPAAKPVPAAAPEAAKPVEKPAAKEAAKPAAKETAKPAAQPAASAAPQPNLSNMAANARDEALGAIDNEEASDPRAVYYETVNHNDGTTTYETRDRGQIVVKDGAALSPEDQQRIETYKGRQSERDGIEQRYQQMLQHLQGGGDGVVPPSSGVVADAARASGGGNAHVAAFVQQYGEAAKAAGDKLGVDPNLLLTQWGHETGWGKSVIPGTNNLGNIKAVKGQGGVAATDNMTGSRDNYAQYASPHEFADQYVNLVQSRYPGAVGAGSDMGKFATALKAGGYAEDPAYVNKLQAAYKTVQGAGGGAAAAPAQVAPAGPVPGARDYRDPLGGMVQVIDMTNGNVNVTKPGMGSVFDGMSMDEYNNVRAAMAKNPQLANRLQVTERGPAVDGLPMPSNVLAGGDGAMAQYAHSVAQGQRIAANPTLGKTIEEATRGEFANRGHQIAANAQLGVADKQTAAQQKVAEIQAAMHRYIKKDGGVNKDTGVQEPDSIFDQSTGKTVRELPPEHIALRQAQIAADGGGDVAAINAHLQSMYPHLSVTPKKK